MVNLFYISRFNKNRGILMAKTGNENEVKYKRNFLEVSGYWFWVLEATEGSSGPFPRVGEDDL